jgi:hypothetical protein
MNYSLLIHTHSSYSYLWPIINDYIKKYTFKKVLLYDAVPENSNLPDNFDKCIQYDSSHNFARRLLEILPILKTDYILFVPDVDIVVNLNVNALETYIELMKENNIERVHMAVFDGNEQIHNNIYALCDLNSKLKQNSNHFIPYDAGPALWNKNSFLKLLNKFPQETYNTLELKKDVQNYCKTELKCFGIQLTTNLKVKYHYGRTYCSDLDFLHITVSGKFYIPFSCYHDHEKELNYIIEKYKLDIENIGSNKAHAGCFNYKKLYYQ